jgi:glycosidase
MNYQFTAPTIAFVAGDRVVRDYANPSCQTFPPLDAPAYASKIEALLRLYPWDIQLTQLNLLDSHDTARLITLAGGDKASVALATLLLFTFPGATCIYYGDEVGLEGGPDPDCRRGFPSEANWDQEVLDYHRQLAALRHTHPALRTGDYQVLFAQGSVYAFARTLGTEELIVALNVGMEPVKVNVEPQGIRLPEGVMSTLQTRPDHLLYGSGTAEWVGGGSHLNLSLPPRTGLILRAA